MKCKRGIAAWKLVFLYKGWDNSVLDQSGYLCNKIWADFNNFVSFLCIEAFQGKMKNYKILSTINFLNLVIFCQMKHLETNSLIIECLYFSTMFLQTIK